MIEIPDPGSLRDAAEELREGTPHHVVPGSPADWRGRVAAWLENEAAKLDQKYMCHYWDGEPPTGPVGGPGFTPCAKCVPINA